MECALDRYVNYYNEIDLLVTSGTIYDVDLKESFKIAADLKGLLALKTQDLISSQKIEIKNAKIKSLKDILSKFDWQSTDVYNGKNESETAKMKCVFLATYQLLAELDKVDVLNNIEVKGGKVKVVVNNLA